jgi:mRNA interferase RelE/StbE
VNYSLKIKSSARISLSKIDKESRIRLIEAIDNLANNPFRGTQLKGDLTGLRRIRIGQYRIIYEIQSKELIILLLSVGHRRDIYRKKS